MNTNTNDRDEVYRFFKVENEEQAVKRLTQVVEENTLFASCPKAFNDPFEFKLNIRLEGTEEEIRAKYFSDNPSKTDSDYEMWRRITLRPNALLHVSREVREGALCSYAVTCFAREVNNHLMWSHYGPDHRSFCAVFDTEKIRSSEGVQMSGPVEYAKQAPCINFLATSNREVIQSAFFTKSDVWKYEQEFRLVFHRQGVFKFPADSLKGIVLGCRAYMAIRDYSRRLLETTNLRVEQMVESQNKYRLERILVKKNVFPMTSHF